MINIMWVQVPSDAPK